MTIRQIIFFFNHKYKSFWGAVRKHYPEFYQITQKREWPILIVFSFLVGILFLRLFFLQIISARDYDTKLSSNHDTVSNLKAQR